MSTAREQVRRLEVATSDAPLADIQRLKLGIWAGSPLVVLTLGLITNIILQEAKDELHLRSWYTNIPSALIYLSILVCSILSQPTTKILKTLALIVYVGFGLKMGLISDYDVSILEQSPIHRVLWTSVFVIISVTLIELKPIQHFMLAIWPTTVLIAANLFRAYVAYDHVSSKALVLLFAQGLMLAAAAFFISWANERLNSFLAAARSQIVQMGSYELETLIGVGGMGEVW